MYGRRLLCLVAIASAWTPCIGADPASDNPTDKNPATCDLNIGTQPLDKALQEIARQCGVQVIYFSQIAEGIASASALRGRYAIDDALRLVLARTGLGFRHINAQTIEIQSAAAENAPATASNAAEIAKPARGGRARRVAQAGSDREEVVVINGRAEDLVATRVETPLREIPQTIAVIGAEQMRQQNNFDLSDVLNDAVGISSAPQDSLFQLFYSRSFQITNYTLDGGGALLPFASLPWGPVLLVPDIGEFDHVEVLRGADALFGADGPPGGAVNLARKRPLDTPAMMFSSSAGSWNNYRQEVDVTGPLALEGRLRGRLDATYSHQDSFYKFVDNERKSIFGVLDYDLTPTTLLTVGGSYRRDRGRPFEGGLPMLGTGADPHLPRSTSYAFDWSRFETQVREGYIRIKQDFSARWRLKVNATLLNDDVSCNFGSFLVAIDPATGGIPSPPITTTSVAPTFQKQFNLEATLTGTADWLGRHEELAFGGDFVHAHSQSLIQHLPFGQPLADARNFNPADYPQPPPSPATTNSSGNIASTVLSGLFASLRIQLTAPWSLTSGLRVSNQRGTNTFIAYYPASTISAPQPPYEDVGKVTPYAGTLLAISDIFSLYASYADIYQSNYGALRSGETPIPPADGINMEAGIKGSWGEGALNASLAFYKTVQRDVAQYVGRLPNARGPCCFTGGRITSKGVDLQITGRLVPGWFINAGYTFNNNALLTPGSPTIAWFPLTPHHLFKLWTSYDLPGTLSHWSIGGSLQAQSAIYNDAIACPLSDSQENCILPYRNYETVQKSYAVVSPRIGYRFDRHWQIALTVNNVFDRRYFQTVEYPLGSNWYGEPRNFLVRIDGTY